MLIPVRFRWSSAALLVIAILGVVSAIEMRTASARGQTAQQPSQGAASPAQAPAAQPAQGPALQPSQAGARVLVLDPAHGGADAGARGEGGVNESEIVLNLAQQIRAELERRGLRVVLTRQGIENPTFDERSAAVNGQRGAIFISLHVSSTGLVGTARAYSVAAGSAPEAKPVSTTPPARAGLIRWDQAQESFAPWSRQLAELIQAQFAVKFRGSPDVPGTAPVRQLRTVAAPAIAIEISSVSVVNRKQIEQMGPALADAVARTVEAFRPVYEAGAK